MLNGKKLLFGFATDYPGQLQNRAHAAAARMDGQMDERTDGTTVPNPSRDTPAGSTRGAGAGGCRAAWLCCRCHLPRHQHFCRFCFHSRDGAAEGRAGPTSSTRGSLGTQDHGHWEPGVPPPRGQDAQPQPAAPLGTPSWHPRPQSTWGPCPQGHRSSCCGDKEGPPSPSADPWLSSSCPCHRASPHAEPAKTLSQGQGEQHSCFHPCWCHHRRCPQREDTHAMPQG